MLEPTPAAPRLSGTQRLWLRELGLDRTLLAPIAASRPISAKVERESSAIVVAPNAATADPAVAVGTRTVATPATAATAATVATVATVDVAAKNRPSAAGVSAPQADVWVPSAVPATRVSRLRTTAPSDKPAATPLVRAAAADSPVATADDDTLRAQVEACTACALCDGRRHAVYGAGATTARWMVVGEAPGEQEDSEGLPFAGRAGQLLDAMLHAVGMNRSDDVFLANVIKCRPPGNRNPKPEEIAACSPFLMRQIALVRPAGVLVLGRFAAQALLGTDASIAQLRGEVHTFTSEDGREIPAVVSYHPAYLLRTPIEKARAWQDLQLAAGSLVAAA